MNLITETLRAQLLANGQQSLDNDDFDPPPVVKLFTPDAGATWLLTEINPDDHDHAFGLCDLGQGFPELGYVRLAELQSVRGRWAAPFTRLFFLLRLDGGQLALDALDDFAYARAVAAVGQCQERERMHVHDLAQLGDLAQSRTFQAAFERTHVCAARHVRESFLAKATGFSDCLERRRE